MEIETHNPKTKGSADSRIQRWLPEVALTVGLSVMAVIVVRIIYHDSFVDGSTYSNRSFALPSAGFSMILVAYGFVRLRMISLWLRLVGVPFAFLAGQLGIGLIIILLNTAV